MALEDELLQKIENGVLWLTINRADKGNAIPFYVRDALTAAFRDANTNLNVRAIVVTAAGEKHFCTGSFMRGGFQQMMQAIQDCEKPVIVAQNGTAAGGGSMLVLAADLVIAADSARLIQVFVRRGLIPDGGVAYLLPRVVGMHKAKELIFFGDDLSAQDAATLGIVNKVVPAGELQAAAKEWAERLASGPTKAIGWSKKMLHDASQMSRRDFLEQEAMLVEINGMTVDSKEGVASFRERRAPEWKGW
jgi:2-(1,2-epoxy-1,2-dihydrophenyl)acetyl-CoA isomerase